MIKKYWPVLLFLAACSTAPSLLSYFVAPDIIQYFLPPTDWKAQGSKAKAQPDITFRTGVDGPAVVNISFYGDKNIPRKIASATFVGNGTRYPLENLSIIYPEPKKRMLRITGDLGRDTLAALFGSQSVTLVAEIDGLTLTFVPGKDFHSLKDDFSTAISY